MRIDLEREDEESALGTTVTVPTSFEIEPLEQEEYSSTEAVLQMIALSWSPPALGYMGGAG